MEYFIGQISYFTFGFVPSGWLICDGAAISINAYQPLFAILGTRYGGNGSTDFRLPNLIGAAAAHPGGEIGVSLGGRTGSDMVALTNDNLPAHGHVLQRSVTASGAGSKLSAPSPQAGIARVTYLPAGSSVEGSLNTFARTGPFTASFHPTAISVAGGGQPHENRQPFLTLVPAICTDGVFPVRP